MGTISQKKIIFIFFYFARTKLDVDTCSSILSSSTFDLTKYSLKSHS